VIFDISTSSFCGKMNEISIIGDDEHDDAKIIQIYMLFGEFGKSSNLANM
jgi:hypothetical protein